MGTEVSVMLGSDPFSERTIPPSLRFFPFDFPPVSPPSGTGARCGASALEEEPPGVVKARKTSVALEGEEALPPDGSTSMPCAAAGLWEKRVTVTVTVMHVTPFAPHGGIRSVATRRVVPPRILVGGLAAASHADCARADRWLAHRRARVIWPLVC